MRTDANSLRTRAAIVTTLCSMIPLQAAQFAGGTGEPNDPYQIATAEQLVSIGSDPNLLDKHFVLLNDIDLDPNLPGGRVFTQAVIAPDTHDLGDFEGVLFTGTFDGCGYSIRNLVIHSATADHLSLFGYISSNAVVKDLAIEDAQIGGQQGGCHSALAARNDGRIVRCCAEASVSGSYGVAVLVGRNGGEIIESWAKGDVVGSMAVGGLVGYNHLPGVIVGSHATSDALITDRGREGGGLVGSNYGGVIVNCYATGSVSATVGQYLGGLVGSNDGDGIIAHCYATGGVSVERGGGTPGRGVNDCLGGFVGYLADGSIHACYATGCVSGGDNSGPLGGLVGSAGGGHGTIADSYAIGRVSGGNASKLVGGLAGYANVDYVTKACFWDIQTSGSTTSAGGAGLTTAQMQAAGTFLDAGWDFIGEAANGTEEIWWILDGKDYPRLWWELERTEEPGED